jgi:hypothetical protein
MLSIEEIRQKLESITLKHGSHGEREAGMCAMEAAAWIAGEPHSDSPACVSPIIASFMRSWNDGMNEIDRQKLKAWLPRVLNTVATPEIEQRRGLMAADWTIRVFTPTWLDLANLGDEAAALRALPEVRSWDDVEAAQPALDRARTKAAAARDAAWDAARDAARAAAWAAARDEARDAAWDAARAAARDAAWDEARDAAWDAARAAARDAAWAAARDEARSAADAALAGTVERLQRSAFELLERMIALTPTEAATT